MNMCYCIELFIIFVCLGMVEKSAILFFAHAMLHNQQTRHCTAWVSLRPRFDVPADIPQREQIQFQPRVNAIQG